MTEECEKRLIENKGFLAITYISSLLAYFPSDVHFNKEILLNLQ